MCVGEVLEIRQKEDTKKRKQFSELKAQMEHEVKVLNLFVLVHNLLSALLQRGSVQFKFRKVIRPVKSPAPEIPPNVLLRGPTLTWSNSGKFYAS